MKNHTCYFLNNILHRKDVRTVEYNNGSKHLCINGVRHRLDGHAVENFNGIKACYIK